MGNNQWLTRDLLIESLQLILMLLVCHGWLARERERLESAIVVSWVRDFWYDNCNWLICKKIIVEKY